MVELGDIITLLHINIYVKVIKLKDYYVIGEYRNNFYKIHKDYIQVGDMGDFYSHSYIPYNLSETYTKALEEEKTFLKIDKEKYLEFLKDPLEDRLIKSELNLNNKVEFHENGNKCDSPIRNGLMLFWLYKGTK